MYLEVILDWPSQLYGALKPAKLAQNVKQLRRMFAQQLLNDYDSVNLLKLDIIYTMV
jgi:hypothetical protein